MQNIQFPRINERLAGQTVPGAVLFVSPGFAVVCAAGTIQLSAHTNDGAADSAATGVTWASSDTTKATVDNTGLVTRVADGSVVISATANGQTAYAVVQLFSSGTCCDNSVVGTVLVVDRSDSMGEAFGTCYQSKLAATKVIAVALVNGLTDTKDYMAVEEFDGAPQTLVQLVHDKSQLTAAITKITRAGFRREKTTLISAVSRAVHTLDESTVIDRNVIVVLSDGVIDPEPGSADLAELFQIVRKFKDEGGIMICVGMNASGTAYTLLRDLATGGYFVNVQATAVSVSTSITALLNMRQLYCGLILQAAPVLSSDFDEENLQWTYSGTNPAFWKIQRDLGAGFVDYTSVVGSARLVTSPPNAITYRIYGVDASLQQITQISNSAFVF